MEPSAQLRPSPGCKRKNPDVLLCPETKSKRIDDSIRQYWCDLYKTNHPLAAGYRRILNKEFTDFYDVRKVKIIRDKQILIKNHYNLRQFEICTLKESQQGLNPITRLFEEIFVDLDILCEITEETPDAFRDYPLFLNRAEVAQKAREYELDHLNLPNPDLPMYVLAEILYRRFPKPLASRVKKYVTSSSILIFGNVRLYKKVHKYYMNRHAGLEAYFIKSDLDAPVEAKAHRVIHALTHGFDDYRKLYRRKFTEDFSHATISQERMGVCYVSREVNRVPFDASIFEEHDDLLFNYERSRFLKEPEEKQHTEAFTQLKIDLQKVGKFSSPFHALIDLILFSGDSHESQYIPVEGENQCIEFIDIDLSRVLSNIEVYTLYNKVYCPIRSLFLTFCHQFDPMPDRLIALIDSWNIDQIKKELTPLLGTHAEFTTELFHYYISRKTIKKIAAKKLSENCYSKLHPEVFTLLIERLEKTKAYINRCRQVQIEPTVYNLFRCLYPQISAFMNVLLRLNYSPAQLIHMIIDENELDEVKKRDHTRYQSLESIIEKVRAKSLATQEEFNTLLWAYYELKQKAKPYEQYKQFFTVL